MDIVGRVMYTVHNCACECVMNVYAHNISIVVPDIIVECIPEAIQSAVSNVVRQVNFVFINPSSSGTSG